MAFQKTALLSFFLRATQFAGPHFGGQMRPVAAVLAISLALSPHAMAATSSEPSLLHEMGEQVCQQVLDAGDDNILGPIDYSALVNEAGIGQSAFCGCVGRAFAFRVEEQASLLEGEDDQAAIAEIFVEALTENLNICLNPDVFFYNPELFEGANDVAKPDERFDEFADADECADGCQDGPVWEDEWDKLQCEYAIDGWTEPSGFDRDFVLQWIEDSGVDAGSLCSCAALMMDDKADEYATEYAETEDPELYWDYLARSIDECQMAIWQRPLL